MKYGVMIVLWLISGLLSAGFINAHFQYECLHTWVNTCDARQSREDLGFSVGLGLLGGPMALVASTIVTGFYTDGWSLEMTPSPLARQK